MVSRSTTSLRLGRRFVEHIEKVSQYSSCVLKVNYHRCPHPPRKEQFIFTLQCHTKTLYVCTDFKFEAHEKIALPFIDVKIKVFRNKLIQYQGTEIHRRFTAGLEREKYSNEVLINKPSVVRTMKTHEVPSTILESGNKDNAPSLTILHKIFSQYETQQDLSRHLLVHLERLVKKYREDTN